MERGGTWFQPHGVEPGDQNAHIARGLHGVRAHVSHQWNRAREKYCVRVRIISH